MSLRSSAPVVLLALGVVGLSAQKPAAPTPPAVVTPEGRWRRAVDAWEAGSYIAAIDDLRTLLRSPAAAEYVDRIAELTGEPYVATELTVDGRNPKVSADGQFVTFETGPPASPVTRLVRVGAPPTTLADLPTTVVLFDRSGKRLAWLRTPKPNAPQSAEIVVRDLASGAEKVWVGAGFLKAGLAWSGDDQSVIFSGGEANDPNRSDLYAVRDGALPTKLTDSAQATHKAALHVGRNGTIVYTTPTNSPFVGGRGGAPGGRGGGGGGIAPPETFHILANGKTRTVSAHTLALSADGSTIATLLRAPDGITLSVSPAASDQPKVVRTVTAPHRIDAPALSPDGKLVAYQLMTHTDWEIYISDASGNHQRLTRDIQHDLLPRFLTPTTVLSLMGEARHRRSHLYDLNTGVRTKLFSNNTIRTISPEYIWVPSADGKHLVVQADRDGDTISVERSVTVLNLTRRVPIADLLARLDRQHAAESDLVARMTKAYGPVADLARRVVARGSVNRVYEYEKTMVDFDSKNITMPGNAKAIEYLEKTYRSFGYEPELQWFTTSPRGGGPGIKTANVVATLRGTEDPHLVYVVSSHFDSVAAGPGADDDTSGTAALLEAARMLQPTPLPVTIKFASLTGEESGLLGAGEFVRVAKETKMQVVGALNNDMIGWGSESSRMDNTIRYSNAGIKDLQHGAAFLFTNLITYDARYYRGTDAAAFFDAWGDIVGGIGSYPVLANPNYHQPTDFLETMNFRQILETAKVTAATLVYLASSPSRLKDVKVTRTAAGVEVTWTPSPESKIKSYIVAYGPATDPLRTRVTATAPRIVLPALPAGMHVAVKAINARGLEGWDWARVVVQ